MNTIENVLSRCPHQVSLCHQHKALDIDHALQAGTSFTVLGGKRVRSCSHIVRFKLGYAWRLLYIIDAEGFHPLSLVSRQCFERELKRRRVPMS
ncbi:hypothetical protein ACKC9G_05555 [Pokkaliibacter sp. CJK22405]|uniref:ParE family toxin-like protein n=1 Tax=Pokkaliibacter sp. CJK22405 TaxID=3384615 RepID=UPI00398560B9